MANIVNECGTCTLCCELHNIPSLNKPKNVLCVHADGGCKIYPDRPNHCRVYSCLWLVEDGAPELKPALRGAAFEATGSDEVVNLRCRPFLFNTLWGDKIIMAEIKRRLVAGQMVIMTDGVRANLFRTNAEGNAWGLLRGYFRELTDDGEEQVFDFREPLAQGMIAEQQESPP